MTQKSVVTREMREAIGVVSETAVHTVERGAVIKFAQAIEDPNPLFNDEAVARRTRYGGLIAPPTFLRSMSPGHPRVEFRSPYPAVLDAGSEWEYMQPVRPGDTIAVTASVVDVFERTGRLGHMLFTIRETRYLNQFCSIVALQRNTEISYEPDAE